MEKIYEKDIRDIFLLKTGIDFQEKPDKRSANFFGSSLNIPPREVIMVYMALQDKYDIIFSDEDITNVKFNTFNNVKKMLITACGHC